MSAIKTFFKWGEDGKLLSALHLTDAEATAQGDCTLDEPLFEDGEWPWRIGGHAGSWVARPMEISPGPTYGDMRAMSYPAVEQQLDALWHAMNRGELPMVSAFYEPIKAVKDQYPRPEPVAEAFIMPED